MRVEQEGGYARLGESRPLGDLLEWRSIGVGLALGGCDNVARRAPTLGEPPAIGGIAAAADCTKSVMPMPRAALAGIIWSFVIDNPPSLQIQNAPNLALSLCEISKAPLTLLEFNLDGLLEQAGLYTHVS